MRCPLCSHNEDKVIESRRKQNGSIRRRRECLKCGYRFTSYENIEEPPLMVIKRSGKREEFQLEKIEHGVKRALEKRPATPGQVDKWLRSLEKKASVLSRSTHEIRSETLGELVLENLFDWDKVAYVRFASVYRHFEDLEQFIRVIEECKPKEKDATPSRNR